MDITNALQLPLLDPPTGNAFLSLICITIAYDKLHIY